MDVKRAQVYIRAVKGTGLYDGIIRWYSRSPYTHVEFAWPLTDTQPEMYLGAQPDGGVQVRAADYLDDPFDLFYVNVQQDRLEQLYQFLSQQINKPYDWRAIAGMVLQGLDTGRTDNAWFCSELVYFALARVGCRLLRVPPRQSDRITPRDIAVSPHVHRPRPLSQ